MADRLFAPIFAGDDLLAATGDEAWLQALLDAEAALARAEADTGVVPAAAAEAIVACCDARRFDAAELGRAARDGGNPVIPLVKALEAALPESARSWVHWGATSQDIMDSAAMLVARRGLDLVAGDLAGLADGCARLAEAHRSTLMAGRTLLQQAVPITFGLKAAGWLVGVDDTRRLVATARARLAVQLGGAAGTLASLEGDGAAVAARFAAHLGLAEPVLPWHTARQRVAEVGAALGVVAGTAAKVSGDVALLAQTEVGEAAEPGAPGRGGSSAMPHKRNPIGAAEVRAAARRAHALVPVLLEALVAEHERALGAWHAEWQTLSELLALAGGAAARTRETVAGLEVDGAVMLANLGRTAGALMAERISLALAPHLGRSEAQQRVGAAVRQAVAADRRLADVLADDATVAGVLGRARLDDLVDPEGYLGSTGEWIDRALAAHRQLRLPSSRLPRA